MRRSAGARERAKVLLGSQGAPVLGGTSKDVDGATGEQSFMRGVGAWYTVPPGGRSAGPSCDLVRVPTYLRVRGELPPGSGDNLATLRLVAAYADGRAGDGEGDRSAFVNAGGAALGELAWPWEGAAVEDVGRLPRWCSTFVNAGGAALEEIAWSLEGAVEDARWCSTAAALAKECPLCHLAAGDMMTLSPHSSWREDGDNGGPDRKRGSSLQSRAMDFQRMRE